MIVKITVVNQIKNEYDVFEIIYNNIRSVELNYIQGSGGNIEVFDKGGIIYKRNLEKYDEVTVKYYSDNGREL